MTAVPEKLHEQLYFAMIYCTDFAKLMLERKGEFYPFGAIINTSGQVEARGVKVAEEYPGKRNVFELLMGNLRTELEDGRALAIAAAADVNIPEQYEARFRDGMRITLEASGVCRLIYCPYRLSRAGFFKKKRTIELAECFAVDVLLPVQPQSHAHS